jgi:hypothetical protein
LRQRSGREARQTENGGVTKRARRVKYPDSAGQAVYGGATAWSIGAERGGRAERFAEVRWGVMGCRVECVGSELGVEAGCGRLDDGACGAAGWVVS